VPGTEPAEGTNALAEFQQQQKSNALAALAQAQALAAQMGPVGGAGGAAQGGGAGGAGGAAVDITSITTTATTLEGEEAGVSVNMSRKEGQKARNDLMAKLAARAGIDTGAAAAEEETVKESKKFVIHNCYDKDEEEDENWWVDIKEDMGDECAKFGRVVGIDVKHLEAGGKVVVEFDSIQGAVAAVKVFHDRWFGERQLKCAYI
jgi:hypothetical protein